MQIALNLQYHAVPSLFIFKEQKFLNISTKNSLLDRHAENQLCETFFL